jgi:hypothetical protein
MLVVVAEQETGREQLSQEVAGLAVAVLVVAQEAQAWPERTSWAAAAAVALRVWFSAVTAAQAS